MFKALRHKKMNLWGDLYNGHISPASRPHLMDKMATMELLESHYPEAHEYDIVEVDVVDKGEGWINVNTLDLDNRLDKEVLATNGIDYLVGYLGNEIREWFCESNETLLKEVTHYKILKQP